MRKLYNSIRAAVKGKEYWAVVAAIVVLFAEALTILIVYRQYIVHIALAFLVAAWYLSDKINEREQQEATFAQMKNNEICSFIYNCMYRVINELHDRLSLKRPVDVSSLVPQSYSEIRGSVVVWKCMCLKTSAKKIDEDEFRYYKAILQNRINQLIISGDIGCFMLSNGISPVQIIGILDQGSYLVIEIIFVHDRNSFSFVVARQTEGRYPFVSQTPLVAPNPNQTATQLPIVFNENLKKEGLPPSECIVWWDYRKYPHFLVTGGTGSGKTMFLLSLIRTISRTTDAQLWIADYKAEDFSFLKGCNRYYQYWDCGVGLKDFHAVMHARQSGNEKSRTPCFLVFDEWAAFIASITDRKEKETLTTMLAEIAMLARGFNMHLVISMQRADSSNWGAGGARDNIANSMSLCFGNQSKEATAMLFSEFANEIQPDRSPGTGYLLIGGNKLLPVLSAHIKDKSKLQDTVKTFMGADSPPAPAGEA